MTRNISCKILQKDILRLCLNSPDYLPIFLLRNFCSDYDNAKRMIVNNEYYLLFTLLIIYTGNNKNTYFVLLTIGGNVIDDDN